MAKSVHSAVSGNNGKESGKGPVWPKYTFLEKMSAALGSPRHPFVAIHERGILRGGTEEDRIKCRSWFVGKGLVENAVMPAPSTGGKLSAREEQVVLSEIQNRYESVERKEEKKAVGVEVIGAIMGLGCGILISLRNQFGTVGAICTCILGTAIGFISSSAAITGSDHEKVPGPIESALDFGFKYGFGFLGMFGGVAFVADSKILAAKRAFLLKLSSGGTDLIYQYAHLELVKLDAQEISKRTPKSGSRAVGPVYHIDGPLIRPEMRSWILDYGEDEIHPAEYGPGYDTQDCETYHQQSDADKAFSLMSHRSPSDQRAIVAELQKINPELAGLLGPRIPTQ